MSDTGATQFEWDSTTGVVPIFPLPEISLLPGELLPLHVFEQRYRTLLEDALKGERLIALACLLPGWEAHYKLNPPVDPLMGVGQIVVHRARDNGTADIVLRGVARVRLAQVVRELPYRLGRFEPLPERCSDLERFGRLVSTLEAHLAQLAPERPELRAGLAALGLPPMELAGRLAGPLRFDPELKRSLLLADDQVARLELVVRAIDRSLSQFRIARLLERLVPSDVRTN